MNIARYSLKLIGKDIKDKQVRKRQKRQKKTNKRA